MKRGQVWIETVVYTLIGLAILGTVIAIATPKINKISDQAVISQSMSSLNLIHQMIEEVFLAQGNQREIFLAVKKGEYIIDPQSSSISFILDNTGFMYSQINESFKQGVVNVLTLQKSKSKFKVILSLNYSNFEIFYQDSTVPKTFSSASNPYHLLIQNQGQQPSGLTKINIASI